MRPRQSPAPEPAERKEARRFHRVPADASAVLASTALGRVPVAVLDLSQGGCRIGTRVRCRPGDHFVLRFEALGPRSVRVAWSGEGVAGLSFAEPLSWSVVAGIALG